MQDVVLTEHEWEILSDIWNKKMENAIDMWMCEVSQYMAVMTLQKAGLVNAKDLLKKWDSGLKVVKFTRAGRAYVASFMKPQKVSKKAQEG